MKQKLLFLLLTVFFTGTLFGQNRQLTGIVTSKADNQPIPAVTVMVKGTQTGTTTGGDGRFVLSVKATGGVLEFSSVGFRKVEVPITSSNTYNVEMEVDVMNMTVLKGANAAALYGSRATNGVIIITTKKGKDSRKLGVDFTTSMSMDQVAYAKVPE